MSLLDRLADCSKFNPSSYYRLIVGGDLIGYTEKGFASKLIAESSIFFLKDEKLYLSPELATPAKRTHAVQDVLVKLRDMGDIPGWRNEHYPVVSQFGREPIFTVERAAVALLGVRGYGVHLNGYVNSDKGLLMWIGKRSHLKPTGPGKLDQVVAGGMPIGISVRDNLIKECWEEASIPTQLAEKAQPAGVVTYLTERPDGLRHDLEYVYDLELPSNFTPINNDGEVSDFFLLPLDKIKKKLSDGTDFKFNSGLVALDFLIRHGFITPDEPNFIDLALGTFPFRSRS